MKMIKLLLFLILLIIGLFNRRHVHHEVPVHTVLAQSSSPPSQSDRTPTNPEIVQNAERLTETLRRCQETAHKNRETR
jgi:hypothetical protein